MNQTRKNNLFFILIIALSFFFIGININVQAEDISLEEALNWGVEHNSSIKEMKTNIENIERGLDLIETEYGFKTKISANPIIAGGSDEQIDESLDGTDGENTSSGSSSSSPKITLKTTKLFSNGITLQSEMSIKEEDLFDLEKLSEGPESTFSAAKSLYPVLPIKSEQEKYLASNNLLKARENLTWQQESGEAGERQEIEAKIALKKAEINFLQAQSTFLQQKNRWYLNLGLPEGTEVPLVESSPPLEETIKWADSLEFNLKEEELMELVVDNHYKIRNILLDQDNSQKEAEWNMAKNKAQVDLFGAYSSKDNSWGVGIELSYDISDGGKQKIEDEGYQAKLENLKDDYWQIVSELKLDLKDLIIQQEINNLNLEEKLMSWEKAKLEGESYQIQLQQGLISDSEFQYKMLGWQEAEINFKSAEDEILINKLRMAYFLGFRK
jgi:hypothetical protein